MDTILPEQYKTIFVAVAGACVAFAYAWLATFLLSELGKRKRLRAFEEALQNLLNHEHYDRDDLWMLKSIAVDYKVSTFQVENALSKAVRKSLESEGNRKHLPRLKPLMASYEKEVKLGSIASHLRSQLAAMAGGGAVDPDLFNGILDHISSSNRDLVEQKNKQNFKNNVSLIVGAIGLFIGVTPYFSKIYDWVYPTEVSVVENLDREADLNSEPASFQVEPTTP